MDLILFLCGIACLVWSGMCCGNRDLKSQDIAESLIWLTLGVAFMLIIIGSVTGAC